MKFSCSIALAIVLFTSTLGANADTVADADTNAKTNAGAGAEIKSSPFAGDVPAYKEQAIAAGIDHRYTGPWEYFVGGGVATFDCNGDRLPELYIAGGADKAQ